MITRTHYNGIKSIGLRLEALRQQLERIMEEVGEYPVPQAESFIFELDIDHDDLQTVIEHLNETTHSIAKHLGVTHDAHESSN